MDMSTTAQNLLIMGRQETNMSSLLQVYGFFQDTDLATIVFTDLHSVRNRSSRANMSSLSQVYGFSKTLISVTVAQIPVTHIMFPKLLSNSFHFQYSRVRYTHEFCPLA